MSCQQNIMAFTWLGQLVSSLSPQLKLDSLIYVTLVVNKVTMGQVFLQVLSISLVDFIPPVLSYSSNTDAIQS